MRHTQAVKGVVVSCCLALGAWGCGGGGTVTGQHPSGGAAASGSSGGSTGANGSANGSGAGGTNGNGTAGNGGTNGGSTNGAGGTNGNGTAGNGGSTGGPMSCASDTTKAQTLPLDIYLMLDQSGSMDESVSGGGDKWDAVSAAIQGFVSQSGLAGISVGLQYFGVPPANFSCPSRCDTPDETDACEMGFGYCSGSGSCRYCDDSDPSEIDSCSAADYATPEVEIAPLPGVASNIISSISSHGPLTGTPTSAALQGAIDHAKSWAQSHPGHVVIDVLATDGEPEECDTDLSDINAIAAAGVSGSPKVLTFVIGVGTSVSNLNGIAQAGGTGDAFIVDTNGNVNQQFLAALNNIRGAALGCQYTIPLPTNGGTPDFTKVNVQYTPGSGGAAQEFPKVSGASACPASGSAWYYDNDSAPTQIILCPSTCNTVSADSTGEVDILTGCTTVFQ